MLFVESGKKLCINVEWLQLGGSGKGCYIYANLILVKIVHVVSGSSERVGG